MLAFFQEFFSGGEYIVVQISFVMLIFLLYSDQISGRGKSLRGASPWKKASMIGQLDGLCTVSFSVHTVAHWCPV